MTGRSLPLEQQQQQLLSVAVIGSSGGGTATLGHTDVPALLQAIQTQLQTVQATLSHALLVSLDNGKGMDTAQETVDTATLYQVNPIQNTDDDDEDENDDDETNDFFTRSYNLLATEIIARGTLKQVNDICRIEQLKIARAIQQEQLHGLICISCHVDLFRDTLRAASQFKPPPFNSTTTQTSELQTVTLSFPVTGSGGSSLSKLSVLFGIHLVGNAGGSVANTSFTRAVAYTSALAGAWGRPYEPSNQQQSMMNNESEGTTGTGGPSWTSVLNSCLPAFWCACLLKAILKFIKPMILHASVVSFPSFLGDHQLLGSIETAHDGIENYVLPTVCAAIMATYLSASTAETPTSSLLMASIIASLLSCRQSILGGLVAGYIVAHVTERVLYASILRGIPTTMTNLLTTGGVGAVVAICLMPIVPFFRLFTQTIRWLLLSTVSNTWTTVLHEYIETTGVVLPFPLSSSSWRPILLRGCSGFLWGIGSFHACQWGGYHKFHLPLILVEMETADPSFLGAVDELTLVLVCAGICLGNILAFSVLVPSSCTNPPILTRADVAISKRGLLANLLCGDFVETCYPFMANSRWITIGGYLGSGLSVAWLVVQADGTPSHVPKSLAYLPAPVSILLAGNEWKTMAVSSSIAMGIPLFFTLSHYVILVCCQSLSSKNKPQSDNKNE